jgi:hypothetical protein
MPTPRAATRLPKRSAPPPFAIEFPVAFPHRADDWRLVRWMGELEDAHGMYTEMYKIYCCKNDDILRGRSVRL